MIVIKFPNGDVFHLAEEIVALSRTEHYAKEDGFEVNSDEWKEEYQHSLNHEINDWLVGNMNWGDIEPYASKQPVIIEPINYASSWHLAKIETH